MKKKSIMGLEYKWEVFLVYLFSILGFIFSFMKDKKVDKDVKIQYNQSGAIFIINFAIYFISKIFSYMGGLFFLSWALFAVQIVMFVFVIITVVKAFENETYKIPVIYDMSQAIWK